MKATFFVVGDWVDKYPESVKALHDAGHEVMNHSNTHAHYPQLSAGMEPIQWDVDVSHTPSSRWGTRDIRLLSKRGPASGVISPGAGPLQIL